MFSDTDPPTGASASRPTAFVAAVRVSLAGAAERARSMGEPRGSGAVVFVRSPCVLTRYTTTPTAIRSSRSLFISRMIRSPARELLPLREGAPAARSLPRPRVRLPDPLRARALRAADSRGQPGRPLVADDAPEKEGFPQRVRRLRRREGGGLRRAGPP